MPITAVDNINKVREIIEETIQNTPKMFEDQTPITLKALTKQILHKYDLYRLNLLFQDEDGDLSLGSRRYALVQALKTIPYVTVTENSGEEVFFVVTKVPDTTPKSFDEALRQLANFRIAMRNWKDLGAMVVDAHGAIDSLKQTAIDQERVLRRVAMLAVYFRDLAANALETLPEDSPERRKLDPTPAEVGEMVMDPSNYIKATRLSAFYATINPGDKDA